jgi:penicillin amidase
VREVLASGRKLTLTDMMQLQQDEMSLPARALVPLLRELSPETDLARAALHRLREWDFVLDRDSPEAGIYVMWERRLHDNLRALVVPEEARPHIEMLSMKRIIDWLLLPDDRFGPDPLAGRDALLLKSLVEAVQELERRFGPQIEVWSYGQPGYKHALFQHALSAAVNDELRAKLDVGPFPRGGNSYTVNNTGGADNQPSGGSFRVIIDTGDWDHAVATNMPGQSGVPDEPHYRDLGPLWANGRYFPLFYSREKVESVREQTLRLKAAK